MKDKRYANRGKELESLIDKTNYAYRKMGVADIRKVPTPFKPLNLKGKLVTGHFMRPDWVDYVGVYNGRAVCLEAKQIKGKNFPLKNIHNQQLEFLGSWNKNGAHTYLIVMFSDLDETYLLPYFILKDCVDRAAGGGRKSISIKEMKEWAYKINPSIEFSLNYLDFFEN